MLSWREGSGKNLLFFFSIFVNIMVIIVFISVKNHYMTNIALNYSNLAISFKRLCNKPKKTLKRFPKQHIIWSNHFCYFLIDRFYDDFYRQRKRRMEINKNPFDKNSKFHIQKLHVLPIAYASWNTEISFSIHCDWFVIFLFLFFTFHFFDSDHGRGK